MRISSQSFVAFVLVSLALPALAQRGDEEVRASIEKALEKEKIESIAVSVRGDAAVLEGRVRNVFDKDKALEIAFAEPEIESVDAKLEVSSAESDQELGEEIIKEIRRYGRLSIFDDATAIVKEGKVLLIGWVTEPYKKVDMEKRLHDILGIQEFENAIKVLPNSTNDTRLRRTLANRLYRDPMFSDLANMSIPPIHIIVDSSRVLLTGVARSKLAKQKAETIIRSTPGVLSFESRLRVDN